MIGSRMSLTPEDVVSIREALGFTRADLAKEVGVKHAKSVKDWEEGVCHPTAARKEKLESMKAQILKKHFPQAPAVPKSVTEAKVQSEAEAMKEVYLLANKFQNLSETMKEVFTILVRAGNK